MKKRFLIYSFFAIATTGLVGCSEDFLDPVRDTSVLTDEDFANNADANPALIEGTLTGIYTYMARPFAALGSGAARHYDIGHKGIDIWTDMLSSDMALSNNAYNWYANFTNLLSTNDFTQQENQITWTYLYKVVNLSNIVIQNLGGNDAIQTTVKNKHMMGQAKAARAYAYFYLTQLFQREYNPNQAILPLYDGERSLYAKQPAADIYALIIDDLNQAIDLLGDFQRTQKYQINKPVAQGLLAYTYAAMGMYNESKVLSDDIIANSGHPLTTTAQLAFPGAGSGFNNVNTPSWMWGFDVTPDLGYGLVSWWGIMDVFTYSYAGAGDRKAIDNALYAQIPANDVRRTQFSSAASTLLMPTNKFFHQGRVAMGQQVVETDYIYMRVEEFYLLSAEAAAMTGDDFSAKNRLKELLASRLGGAANANAYVDPLSGDALKKAIHLQTRIELWGEGKSYFALKRNKASVTRGTNHTFLNGQTINYDETRMIFKIPIIELNNNPSITEQN
ncbi:RagB/SusD family nutrient uptake outer membrane protein [Flavobacterium solisilvae]|uniref:RagB/SusD family nutrient uptake outer membrane protein n=1 Tax=Flavobacterium solisilvae TaxID=1852019 RepID=A0ABX1QXE2_9FLAO|nr:RagB/SusD family nutrient uptake outer membrane protein [Flavobacterium solisilvae]NMH25602.1 RagB/SusD family nutrient uptake outer membrane protein [Flavobacterium solisilvae]